MSVKKKIPVDNVNKLPVHSACAMSRNLISPSNYYLELQNASSLWCGDERKREKNNWPVLMPFLAIVSLRN